MNRPISDQQIVSLAVVQPYLYVALIDGNLITIDINTILSGEVASAGEG